MRRLFRALMRLFPADFRGDFGDEMQEVFTDELTDAGSRRAQARAWSQTMAGILRTGPRLHLEQAWQDTRYGLRNLARTPGFTTIAVLALSFGIGASVSTFALADAFMFRPLPFAEPDRLVHVWAAEPARDLYTLRVSRPEFESWANRTDLFDDAAVFNYSSVELTSGREPERVSSGTVGPNVFSLLGTPPLLGRTFQPDDGVPGAPRVAMLSETFWRARLDAREDVVGSTIEIAGEPYTVVGVMPASFVFPLPTTELWTPRVLDPVAHDADYQAFQVVARLRPDVTSAQAVAALDAAAPDLSRAHPSLEGRTAHIVPLRSALNFADDILSVGFVIVGIANLLVLLAACANISSLMLGRAVRRGREVAVRAALGASRFRLVRQFLVESVVLALIGGVGGTLVATWSLGLAAAVFPDDLYRVGTLSIDWRALGAALALAFAAAFTFGLMPASRFARVNLGSAMRQDGGGGTTSRSSLRLQSLMVQAQIGLSVVLLVGTVLVARSFVALTSVDPGFDPKGVLSLQLVLPRERYADAAALARFHAEVTARAAAVPGVTAATTVDYLPLNHESSLVTLRVAGFDDALEPRRPEALLLSVGTDYFAVMGIPVRQGREFTAADGPDQPRAVIISASLAQRYWPDGGALGATVRFARSDVPFTVVGVVANSQQVALADAERDQVFVAEAQQPRTYLRLLSRTSGDPRALTSALTAAVHAVDPLLPIVEVRTLDDVVDEALLPQRSLSLALLAMGGFSLALALLGIYGIVMVYAVDRTREMGIRVALGADERRIVRYVMARGLRLAAVGASIGLAVSIIGSLALRGMLFGIGAGDPLTYATVVALVVGVAALAGVLPARRAARISPLVAMKTD
jgi:putative ABC transport system permease protein